MSTTTVSLKLVLRGQQAQQQLSQMNKNQADSTNALLRNNRLLEGVLRQQAIQTRIQSQSLAQQNRLTQQNAQNMSRTASASGDVLRTNRLLEQLLRQQTRQTNTQNQQLRQQTRDYQLQLNMLRQQAAAAERLREQLRGAGNEQRNMRGGTGAGLQTAAGIAGGLYAGSMIVGNALKDPRDYMRQVSLATDTALAGQKMPVNEFNQKIKVMDSFVRNAARNGGSTPTDTIVGLNTLTASNVYDFNQLKGVLLNVSKTAFASGANAGDVAAMAVAQKNFGLSDLPRANDQAMRAGQLGSFELRDMARYMPDILTQGKNAGYMGDRGYQNLLTMMQLSKKTAGTSEAAAVNLSDLLGSFSQYHLGLSFAKHIKLEKGDPIAKYGVSKKRAGFDWTTYAANMRAQGVGEVEAAAMLMQRQMNKSPLYREYQAKAQKALSKGDNKTYTENLQAATQIAAQSEIGKIFHNKQALLSFMGITMNMGAGGEQERLAAGIANSQGAVDISHARQSAQEYAKDGSLNTANFYAGVDAYNGAAGPLGKLKQDIADWAVNNESIAAAAKAAAVALTAVAAAGGIAALTMRGGGAGGAGAAAGGLFAKTGKWLSRGAIPLTLAAGAYNTYDTYSNDNLSQRQKNINYSRTAGETSGAIVGGIAGAKAGGAIGTMIVPGLGTAIGGAVGGIAGGIGGYFLGGASGEGLGKLFNNSDDRQIAAIDAQTKAFSDIFKNQPALQVNVNLDGKLISSTVENRVQTQEKRHGTVPFYLQRR